MAAVGDDHSRGYEDGRELAAQAIEDGLAYGMLPERHKRAVADRIRRLPRKACRDKADPIPAAVPTETQP